MSIKFHNTLTGMKEEFQPQNEKEVSMYVCGVTPYDEVHLGHARAYVAFDIIKRHLLKRKYKVRHVQNFTDIDDKIINRAAGKGISPAALAQTYIDDYFAQTDKLNIMRADHYPRVTEMIPEIIEFIKKLICKGYAYEIDGDVYYAVNKFKEYGKLSKRNTQDLKAGARVDICGDKNSAFDFALWKKTKDNEPADASWNSPWGKGRPGWHIECSVMSSEILGKTIDIHGGGQDLIFPHHENEIAQSEACFGCRFVRYWIHNGFVTVNKEKMSKSLNNFFTLKTIFEKYDPRVVRYYLLTQHYKSPLDFSDSGLEAAKKTLQGLDDAYLRLLAKAKHYAPVIEDSGLAELENNFLNSLDDDFNSEKALSYLHELKNMILKELFTADTIRLWQMRTLFERFAEESLGIILPREQTGGSDIEMLFAARNDARKAGNWTEADRLRKVLDEKGYKIVDNKDGTSVLMKKI